MVNSIPSLVFYLINLIVFVILSICVIIFLIEYERKGKELTSKEILDYHLIVAFLLMAFCLFFPSHTFFDENTFFYNISFYFNYVAIGLSITIYLFFILMIKLAI